MQPLVSILMPCFNAAATLPVALGSLVVQTYDNWECILVDDGSIDRPWDVAERFRDPRIRYFRHSRNLGRSAARQTSTQKARGVLLTMVDADDWIYPEKLATQVEILSQEPKLAAVSSSIGIVDRAGQFVGVRGPRANTNLVRGYYEPGNPLPFSFAPSMFRAALAEGVTFNPRYELGEDLDFLTRVIANQAYGIITQPLYIYTEHTSVTLAKVLKSNASSRDIYLAHRHTHPIRSRWLAAKTCAKLPFYVAAHYLGFWDRLIAHRSGRPTPAQVGAFFDASAAVSNAVARFCGQSDAAGARS